MPGRDIVVLGASAGGVHALAQVIGGLPPALPASIFAVLHLGTGKSSLPAILRRVGGLPVKHPETTELIQRGWVYVAPPDRHMVLSDSAVHLLRGPRENGHRPAIDVLFRSAARTFGQRVIGVVLTGNLDDGTAGLAEIKQLGGLAMAQDPAEADYPSMPQSAIEHVQVDHVVALAGIAPLLAELVGEAGPPAGGPGAPEPPEPQRADMTLLGEFLGRSGEPSGGAPSGYTCPDCGGVLWEWSDGELLRYRCRTGHAFSPDSLVGAQSESLEAALWAAVRSLEETAGLARRMAARVRGRGLHFAEERYSSRAREAEHHSAVLRDMLVARSLPETGS